MQQVKASVKGEDSHAAYHRARCECARMVWVPFLTDYAPQCPRVAQRLQRMEKQLAAHCSDVGDATVVVVSAAVQAADGLDALVAKMCPPGMYVAGSVCVPCPPGRFSAEGGSYACSVCPKGFYAAKDATKCVQCEAGSFAGVGASECTTCPPGTYAHAGASECQPCLPGYFASGGATECTMCPQGTYQPVAKRSSCMPCPEGPEAQGLITCV